MEVIVVPASDGAGRIEGSNVRGGGDCQARLRRDDALHLGSELETSSLHCLIGLALGKDFNHRQHSKLSIDAIVALCS